jgi:hypothetical protein
MVLGPSRDGAVRSGRRNTISRLSDCGLGGRVVLTEPAPRCDRWCRCGSRPVATSKAISVLRMVQTFPVVAVRKAGGAASPDDGGIATEVRRE